MLSGCRTGIKFNPDVHVARSDVQGIINERDEVIYAYEEAFDEFGCMHRTKWLELSEILRRASLPKSIKRQTRRIVKKAVYTIDTRE